METQKQYLTTALVYLVALGVLLAFQDVLTTVFVVLVLAVYHMITYWYFQSNLTSAQTKEKQRLLYELDQTQRVIHEAATQFDSLSAILDSGLLLIDDEERIKKVNKAFEGQFALDFSVGDAFDVFEPVKGLYRIINEGYITEKRHRAQMVHEDTYYDVNVTPIFEENRFLGCLVVVQDITPLKTAEAFQKQFTADVSHELKTPLSAIKGIVEILKNNEKMDASERTDFIKTLFHETTRLENILNDLLIISKMDRLDYELKTEPTDIKALIEDEVRLLKADAEEKKLELSASVEACTLEVDPTKFRQVVLNLLKNALVYTDEGAIEIKGVKKDNAYEISVKDTGIGIDKQEQESVFKRFYRVDGARSRESGGSGLGLSIIKNVVKKHQGEIKLASTPGKGSTFTVTLPLRRENR